MRCPARPQAGRAHAPEEAYGDEALAFTRGLVLQRDCEVEVESVDKNGTFLGTLRVPAPTGGHRAVNLGGEEERGEEGGHRV